MGQLEDFWNRLLMELTSVLESVMKVMDGGQPFMVVGLHLCASETHSQWSPSHLGGG